MHHVQPQQDVPPKAARNRAPAHRTGWWASAARFIRLWVGSAVGRGGVRVHRVWSGPRPEALHRELIAFERSIPIALLDGRTMTYEHPRDYIAFFRSIETSRTFAARDKVGRVIGTITGVALRLRMPDGAERRAVFVAHLRVATDARIGPTLASLAVRIMPATFRYGRASVAIVQTGRDLELARISRTIGVPAARPHGAVRVVTWSCEAPAASAAPVRDATETEVRSRFAECTRGCIVSVGGNPALRSAIPPRWVMAADGSACGCIEDNNAVLTWRLESGERFEQSHISFFGWRDAAAGGAFVRSCIDLAREMGIGRLRVLVDEGSADAVIGAVGLVPVAEVRWTVWAGAVRPFPKAPWVLHPSEI